MVDWLSFSDIKDVEKYISLCDSLLGFPEPLERREHRGSGVHADLEVGRALHYWQPKAVSAKGPWLLPLIPGASHNGVISDAPTPHEMSGEEAQDLLSGIK